MKLALLRLKDWICDAYISFLHADTNHNFSEHCDLCCWYTCVHDINNMLHLYRTDSFEPSKNKIHKIFSWKRCENIHQRKLEKKNDENPQASGLSGSPACVVACTRLRNSSNARMLSASKPPANWNRFQTRISVSLFYLLNFHAFTICIAQSS